MKTLIVFLKYRRRNNQILNRQKKKNQKGREKFRSLNISCHTITNHDSDNDSHLLVINYRVIFILLNKHLTHHFD